MRSKLVLQPLYKSPPPIYLHPVFVAEVGDTYLEGTGMDGGSIVSSVAALSLAYDRLIRTASTPLGFEIPAFEDLLATRQTPSLTFGALGFSHPEMQALNYMAEAVRQSKDLFVKFGECIEILLILCITFFLLFMLPRSRFEERSSSACSLYENPEREASGLR